MTSLVFPAYNPGPGVDRTWHAVREFLRERPEAWEAIFVLDGCSDGTPERLEDLSRTAPDSRIRVVSYAPNRGKGHAVRVGLLAARGRYRLFTDVDLAYSFADIVNVANALWSGRRVAIASREHPDSTLTIPVRHLSYAYRRSVQSRIFRAVARTLLPLKQPDTQAGLKGMTATVAEVILPRLSCNGFGFDCEFLTACSRSNLSIAEIPVAVRYEDSASTTGLGTSLKMLRDLWQIRKAWRQAPAIVLPNEPEAEAIPSRIAA
ncbi:MAG: glycosyltransferase [Gemmataceae bacterium]